MKSGLLIAFFGLTALASHAEIYKSVDASGHVTYSNIPTKGAKKLNIAPLTTMPPAGSDAGFRVDSQTQKMRDGTRYRILNEELKAEEDRLAASRKAVADAGGDEAKAKESRDDVILHEKNIEALKREITNLK
ncbi:MAG: DUF4124 domain-containing protein [Burkholderiales bacterium]